METKTVDLSMDRLFHYLGQSALKPENVIAFGLLACFVVFFVNWMISVTVILMKPILCFAIMTILMKPELAQTYIAEESVLKLIQLTKSILSSASVSIAGILQKICEHVTMQ